MKRISLLPYEKICVSTSKHKIMAHFFNSRIVGKGLVKFNFLQMIIKTWHLSFSDVNVFYFYKQTKQSRSGIYEISSKGDNAFAKKPSGRPR